MPKTEFESIEDLKEALRAVVEFAEDAVYARLFETPGCDSNLFHIDDERHVQTARIIAPGLNEDPELRAIYDVLDLEKEEQRFGFVQNTREAFLTMGIFLGACIADRSGNALAKLGEAWIRATLAQPRYRHLQERECKRAKSTRRRALKVS